MSLDIDDASASYRRKITDDAIFRFSIYSVAQTVRTGEQGAAVNSHSITIQGLNSKPVPELLASPHELVRHLVPAEVKASLREAPFAEQIGNRSAEGYKVVNR